ncbi:MAG: M1 family metallopeptidase [Promethearchaeota archaeon]
MKNRLLFFVTILVIFFTLPSFSLSNDSFSINGHSQNEDFSIKSTPKLAQVNGNFSKYNLSVIMDESNSLIEGNLSVNFYNNDPLNLTAIPFHLYLSGMQYDAHQGNIEILNVTDFNNPNIALPFQVYSNLQIMWVNLTGELEFQKRSQFIIQFNATLPDGLDRANSHGFDFNQSRIFKFTSFYPIPCVYDDEDGWNTDPYLLIGDPFYFDMAYYNLTIEAPSGMIIAATGQLEEKIDKGATSLYNFKPILPVREVTFSASRYFQVESKNVNGVNISTYFLPKSDTLWGANALNYLERALTLFNNTFGDYNYPTLNVVEEYASYYGMEYSCQVYATEVLDKYPYSSAVKILENIITHEACHQWWYNLVGNDQVDYNFLDEGLTVWSTDYYGEYYYGDWEYFQNTRYVDSVRTHYLDTGLSSKINQSSYEYISTGTNWIFVCYYKAPLILEKLRQNIGHGNFINGLKLYYEQHRFDHAILSDLQESFESVIGASLDWFFFPWFDNPYLPKYSFKSHAFNSETNVLTFIIEDVNEPLNQYTYYQEVPYLIYDTNNQIIESSTVAINGTTTVQTTLSNTPFRIDVLYNNYVLVQLDDPSDLVLELIIRQPFIGYDLGPFLFLNIIAIGIIIVLVKRKKFYRLN